jgi:hypothetical protein
MSCCNWGDFFGVLCLLDGHVVSANNVDRAVIVQGKSATSRASLRTVTPKPAE